MATKLSQANSIGQGFDIYGKYDLISQIQPLFDPNKAPSQPFTFNGNTFDIPAYVLGTENSKLSYMSGAYTSQTEFQSSIGVMAQVKGNYEGIFSGELDAAFQKSSADIQEHDYGYQIMFNQIGYLEINPDPQYLSSNFLSAINKLPNNLTPKNVDQFFSFFDTFGAFFISEIVLGSSMQFFVSISKETKIASDDFEGTIKASYNGLTATGSIDASTKKTSAWQSFSSEADISCRSIGGDNSLGAKFLSAAKTHFNDPSSSDVALYDAWQNSFNTNPAAIQFTLRGIWELCGPKQQAVQDAWEEYHTFMRPKLVILTAASDFQTLPALTISLQQQLTYTGQQINPAFQAIVLDGTQDITKASAVLLNKYYPSNTTGDFWQLVITDLQGYVGQKGKYLIFVSYNGITDPPITMQNIFNDAGAGAKFMDWYAGKFTYEFNAILVGEFGSGFGAGVDYAKEITKVLPLTNVYFDMIFSRSSHRDYTLGEAHIQETVT